MGIERRGGGVGTDFGGWASDTAQRVLRLEQRAQRSTVGGGSDPGGIVEFGSPCCVTAKCDRTDLETVVVEEDAGVGQFSIPDWEIVLPATTTVMLTMSGRIQITWDTAAEDLIEVLTGFAWDIPELGATITESPYFSDRRVVYTGDDRGTFISFHVSSLFTAIEGTITIERDLYVSPSFVPSPPVNPPYTAVTSMFSTALLIPAGVYETAPNCYEDSPL